MAGGHWLLSHRLYVEVLDPAGRPCPPGERGEVTLTGGFNPFLPLLRYRTGDWASLDLSDPRRLRLVDLHGRAPVVFTAADGRPVNNIDVTAALKHLALPQYSLHQAADGSLRLRVAGDLAAGEALRYGPAEVVWTTNAIGDRTSRPGHDRQAHPIQPRRIGNFDRMSELQRCHLDHLRRISPGRPHCRGRYARAARPVSARSSTTPATCSSICRPITRAPGRHFPVLYMHDGQNLFDQGTAFGGNEWQVDETLQALSAEGLGAIVVGLPNAGAARIPEYSPFPSFRRCARRGLSGLHRRHGQADH